MAEKGTRVRDDVSGDFVATRTAATTDDQGRSRVIQIVDFASRQLRVHQPLRGLTGSGQGSADSFDLDNLPSELLDNLIEIGDTSIFVCDCEHTKSDGSVVVTPILFDESNWVIGVRESKSSGMGAAKFQRGSGRYVSPQLQWDSLGAIKVGFHVSNIGGYGNKVKLFGGTLASTATTSTTTTVTASSTSTTTV